MRFCKMVATALLMATVLVAMVGCRGASSDDAPTAIPTPTVQEKQVSSPSPTQEPSQHETPDTPQGDLQQSEHPAEEIQPCIPIEGAILDPCEPDSRLEAQTSSALGSSSRLPSEPRSVRDYLDGTSIGFIPHVVVRATYIPDTVRCVTDVPNREYTYEATGSLMDHSRLTECFADVRVNAYILGSGASKLTVLVDFDHYFLGELAYAVEHMGFTIEELTELTIVASEGILANGFPPDGVGIYGRERILLIGPPHSPSTQAWEVFKTWDLQRREGEEALAIHPARDAYRRSQPDVYQTHKSELEMTLPAFTRAIAAAHKARAAEYGGRVGPPDIQGKAPGVDLPMTVMATTQLDQFFADTMANTHPDGPPSQPPPVYIAAPATVTAENATGDGRVNVTWSAVAGASGYHIQHRLQGDRRWKVLADSLSGTTYTASGLWCDRAHEFQVGAYGDGSTYNSKAGSWSSIATVTIAVCAAQAPVFRGGPYAFDVSIAGLEGDAVGATLAYDLNADPITDSITAGYQAQKFDIDGGTGEVTLNERLRVPVGTVSGVKHSCRSGVN